MGSSFQVLLFVSLTLLNGCSCCKGMCAYHEDFMVTIENLKKKNLRATVKVPFILVMSQMWLLLGSLVIHFPKAS